jgi:aminopeptidase N
MKHLLNAIICTLCITNTFAQKVQFTTPTKHCSKAKIKATKSINYYQSKLLNNYDVKHVKLNINMERTTVDVSGSATLLLKSMVNNLDTIVLELLQNVTVDSIKINGTATTSYTHINDHLFVPSSTVAMGALVSIEVFYKASPVSHGFFSGITNSQNPEVTWTLSESFQARDWWPCKQILSDKIDSVDIWITTDSSNKAGSNGLLKKVTTIGNKKRYEWHSNYMINYYLLSAAVAQYIEYNIYAKPAAMAGDSILIQNYLYDQSYLTANKTLIDKTAKYIEKFSDAFGLYPFWKEKYGHCLTELGGGEEHQTMTTIGDFDNDLVDHELGHQWWGDNVTCATWRDISINEGFASYCEYIGLERTSTALNALNHIKSVQNFVTSQPNGSVYVPLVDADNEQRIFDSRLTYNKGSAIIHMMRFEAQNDSLFFKALQNFQTKFKDSVATGDDLKQVLESTIGISYTDFFNQWYYGEGYPKYGITWSQDNDTLTLDVSQTSSVPNVTPLYKMLMEYTLKSAQGNVTVKGYQTANNNTFKYKLNGKTISSVVVDPNYKVLKKLTTNVHVYVGLNDASSTANIELFPNPTNDKLYLAYEGASTQHALIIITDISGRVLQSIPFNLCANGIDVSKLATGTYLLKLSNGNNTTIKKFNKL